MPERKEAMPHLQLYAPVTILNYLCLDDKQETGQLMSSLAQKSLWENQVGTDEDAIAWEGKQCVTWKEKLKEAALREALW